MTLANARSSEVDKDAKKRAALQEELFVQLSQDQSTCGQTDTVYPSEGLVGQPRTGSCVRFSDRFHRRSLLHYPMCKPGVRKGGIHDRKTKQSSDLRATPSRTLADHNNESDHAQNGSIGSVYPSLLRVEIPMSMILRAHDFGAARKVLTEEHA